MQTQIEEALRNAMASAVRPERGIGCGRIYVAVSDKDQANMVGKAAKKLGFIFQKKSHYGTSNALYIGYDNCDGNALAKGTAVVNALKAVGVSCYRDEQGD